MEKQIVSNPNDFKVVELFNNTDFDFTPELGCMFDGRPLFVGSGERRQFPYHVGRRLADNLAKVVLIKGAPLHDPTNINPTGTPLWSEEKAKAMADSFITELYVEDKPMAQSATDLLMAKVTQLEKMFAQQQAEKPLDAKREEVKSIRELVAPETVKAKASEAVEEVKAEFKDKAEVMEELKKRSIAFNARKSKAELEKLLA